MGVINTLYTAIKIFNNHFSERSNFTRLCLRRGLGHSAPPVTGPGFVSGTARMSERSRRRSLGSEAAKRSHDTRRSAGTRPGPRGPWLGAVARRGRAWRGRAHALTHPRTGGAHKDTHTRGGERTHARLGGAHKELHCYKQKKGTLQHFYNKVTYIYTLI